MNQKINHRDLEQCIGVPENCDDYLKLKIAGYYPMYNNIVIASRRGEDRFFLAARDRKTDLSEAIPLMGRHLVIGDIKSIDDKIFSACALQNKADSWFEIPDSLFISRLLLAGASRVLVLTSQITTPLTQTPEYKQALTDRRVIEIICSK